MTCSFFLHTHTRTFSIHVASSWRPANFLLSPPFSLSSLLSLLPSLSPPSSHTMFPGCSCWSGCYQSGRLVFPQRRWPHCWYSCTRCRQKQKGEEMRRRRRSWPCCVWLISCYSLSTYHHNYVWLLWLSNLWYVYQLCTSPTLNDTALWHGSVIQHRIMFDLYPELAATYATPLTSFSKNLRAYQFLSRVSKCAR